MVSVVLRMSPQTGVDGEGGHTSRDLGAIAQSVGCLPCNMRTRVFIPRTYIRRPGMVACAYNPSPGEAEAEECLGSLVRLASLIGDLQANDRSCSKGGAWHP